MNYIECKGTPREVGQQQGEALRSLIQVRWQADIQPLLPKLQVQHPGIESRIARAHELTLDYLNELAPAIVEELRGMGEGAQLTFDEILLMSTYNSLLFWTGNTKPFVDQLTDVEGCSALAFSRGPVGPFAFKTYDPFGSKDINTPEKRRTKVEHENHTLYVLRAKYKNGPSILGVRMAGSIWTECGVNDSGLAFASASLHPRLYPQQARALPQHFLGTLAVNHCRSVAEVKALFAKVPVYGKGYASSYVDASGDAVGTEKTAAFTGFNPPVSGVAFQTNHVRSAEMVRIGREQDPAFWSGSYHRNSDNRVKRIEKSMPSWQVETSFDALLADLFHAGNPGDLIQDCSEHNQYWITTLGAVALCRLQELWVTEGLPEERNFQKWEL